MVSVVRGRGGERERDWLRPNGGGCPRAMKARPMRAAKEREISFVSHPVAHRDDGRDVRERLFAGPLDAFH